MFSEFCGNFLYFTATQTLDCAKIGGIVPTTSSSGTLKITDQAGATVLDTVSLTAGTPVWFPTNVTGPITLTVGGTLHATLLYKA